MSKPFAKSPLHHAIHLATVAIVLPVSTLALAQDDTSNQLDPLVVTATKSNTKSSSLLAQTTVIGEQTLKRYQGQNVLDVLKTQAGITHYTHGGSDKVSNIYMRGFDGSNILILIDGVPFSSVTLGTPSLGLLSVNDIERIEIVHGASGASLYGANATGGVIQIFTKKGNAHQNMLQAHAGIGSHKRYSYGARANFANDNTRLSLSASHDQTEGVNAVVSPQVPSQRDNDGFDKNSLGVGLSHRLGAVEIGANLLASQAKVAYDDPFGENAPSNIYSKQAGGAVSAYATFDYQNDSQIRLQYGQSQDRYKEFRADIPTNTFNSTQQQAQLIVNHSLPIGKLTGGAEYLQQNVNSNLNYNQSKRNNQGYYLGYQGNLDKLDGQVFVRHDKSSAYGNTTTYNAGVAYRPMPSLRLGANYATGFKAPSFNQLYYPSDGNPNLQPENSKNSEVFVEFRQDNHKTRLTGYYNDVDNKIIGWPSKNVDKATITGATLSSDWVLGNGYLLGGHYDYQKANNTTPLNGQPQKTPLSYSPKHKGLVYVGYQGDDFDIRGEYQQVGDYVIGRDQVDGYHLVNLSGSYTLNPNISITTRINNLLNKKYTTSQSYGTRYNEDGINFYTAIQLSY